MQKLEQNGCGGSEQLDKLNLGHGPVFIEWAENIFIFLAAFAFLKEVLRLR